jgi:putative isomerase
MSNLSSNWLGEVGPRVSERDRRLLERASAVLEDNVVQCPPGGALSWGGLRGICPSPRTYQGVWNWDAAFHAMAVARWDPQLARDQIRIFLNVQEPSGFLPDVLFTDGRINNACGKPPVFPWAWMRVHQLAPDEQLLNDGYEAFGRYESFWRRERGGDAEGLFHYGCNDKSAPAAAPGGPGKPGDIKPGSREQHARDESGWDNSARWDCGIEKLWPIDLNCYMVMLYRALCAAAGALGRPSEAADWNARAEQLAQRIERVFWDDARMAYSDAYRENSKPTGILSVVSFLPLFIGSASAQRADAMARLAADKNVFFPGMPTVSYDNPQYRGDWYWRGPTWLNVAWFALKGLAACGHVEIAQAMRQTILGWCEQNEDDIYEYYDSRTGKGLGAAHFGWSAAFIIEFILDWDGKRLKAEG